jgi:hypothetical protein
MGLMLISFSYPPTGSSLIASLSRHGLVGNICRDSGGRNGVARWFARHNGVRDQYPISIDGDVLYDDLLLH